MPGLGRGRAPGPEARDSQPFPSNTRRRDNHRRITWDMQGIPGYVGYCQTVFEGTEPGATNEEALPDRSDASFLNSAIIVTHLDGAVERFPVHLTVTENKQDPLAYS